jgi:hypothetical protein
MVMTEELVAKVNALGGTKEVAAMGISAVPTATNKATADRVEPGNAGYALPEQAPLDDATLGVRDGGIAED